MAEDTFTLGVVGVGAMGGAIARGVVASGALRPEDVSVCDVDPARLESFAEMGVNVVPTARELVGRQTDIVLVAVKPQVLPEVGAGFADLLRGRAVVSIAAGINLDTLENLFEGARVIRVMPNLPIQVLSGATAIAPGKSATELDVERVRRLFSALGSAQVMREDQLDAEGAVVSCGPAYIALFVDALTRAGVKAGMPAQACREMVEATMLGVAKQLLESQEHPRAYMERVTSPGGTTAAGLYALEPLLVDGAYDAVDAALRRTAELAEGR